MSSSRDDTATLAIAVVVILVLLAGGLVFLGRRAASIRQMAAAEQARALAIEAQVRAQTAEAEAQARTSGAPDDAVQPESAKPAPQSATLREALDQAAAKLDSTPMSDAAAANIHAALGQSYLNLNELDAAQKHFNAALALHVKASGEDSPEAAADRENLAKVAAARSK